MKMQDIRAKAKTMGIKSNNMKKVNLIRAIQEKEGNTPCYQSGRDFCDQEGCCWKQDCLAR